MTDPTVCPRCDASDLAFSSRRPSRRTCQLCRSAGEVSAELAAAYLLVLEIRPDPGGGTWSRHPSTDVAIAIRDRFGC